MPTRDDSAKNAAEFLKLWQEQLTRQFTDPDAIQAMLSAMQAFSGASPAHDAATRRPATPYDAEHDAIRQLSQRLGKLERAVSALAAQLDGKRHAGVSARVDAAKNPARKRVRHAKKPEQPVQRARAKVAGRPKPAKGKPVRKKGKA